MPRPRRPELEARAIALRNDGKTRGEVATELGVSVETVSAWTRGHLKAAYDPLFLSTPTALRAYFLGLFVADGWLEERGGAAYLALNDQELIRLVAEAVHYRNTISKIPLRKWKSRELSGKFSYRISFSGMPLQVLKSLGFTSDKTGNEFIPEGCDGEWFPHFLRGLSDGDGSMSIVVNRRDERLQWSLVCACKEFLEHIVQRLHERGLVGQKVGVLAKGGSGKKKGSRKMFKLSLGHADSVAIGEYMYADASLKLERKYDIWCSGRAIQTNHRHWSRHEIGLARDGVCPEGRSKSAYYAMRRRLRVEAL